MDQKQYEIAYTNIPAFVSAHRADWEALEKTLATCQGPRGPRTPVELETLHDLYLKVTQHLSFCQTYFPDIQTTSYLNDLAVRAHNTLYRGQVTSRRQIRDFFGRTFVRLLSECRVFIIIAAALFGAGGVAGFLAVLADPLNLYTVISPEIAAAIDPAALGRYDHPIDSAAMSAQIMTNNMRVAILAFAGGATLGLLTVYLLLYNGLLIGALAAVYWSYGNFYDFWAFIVPHGMIELTAIFIAGGSGLLMGYRVLVPGIYLRSYRLKTQALQSVQLLLGTIPLFIIAGLIEGFITPAAIPLAVKYLVAALTILALIIYIKFFLD